MRMWLLLAAVLLPGLAVAEPMVGPVPEHGFPTALAPAYITDLQQQLTARGYYAGPVDGRMTGALRAAVSVYQSDVGMRVTGVPDLAVVNMLHFGPDIRATIQPLGEPAKAPAVQGGVPPYEKIEPYRYPAQSTVAEAPPDEAEAVEPARGDGAVNVLLPPPARPERRATRSDEPPPPKAAPQAKVVAQPLK